ncbi:hypothetical protein RIR_e14308_A0A2N0PK90_9GLOM [Rhizophagus irregularis DAOM 181602=DAOM 197198]|nr:hypothetical protein RIR_e14308_A0A2N0PK90_9GLOM [Rhizophagus irregularis DAOM 181602=DAOM 197198]
MNNKIKSCTLVWEEVGDHTVTNNAGSFGDCNDNPSHPNNFTKQLRPNAMHDII